MKASDSPAPRRPLLHPGGLCNAFDDLRARRFLQHDDVRGSRPDHGGKRGFLTGAAARDVVRKNAKRHSSWGLSTRVRYG
jgi:hypothetical protein